MNFSKTELNIVAQIAQGKRRVKEIAKALKKSTFQIYRSGKKLREKDVLSLHNSLYEPKKYTHVSMLIQLLVDYPSLVKPLSDSGLDLLIRLLEPKTVSQLIRESNTKRTQVFKKLKEAKGISLVKVTKGKYALNDTLWNNFIELLKEVKKYEQTTDSRIPASSIIYYKDGEKILFSNKETIDATLSAFSSYEDYGIKLGLLRNYYYLPKKELSIKEIFVHSLYVAQRENTIQSLIFIALFYAKYKSKLSHIKHPIRKNIDKIFEGEQIPRYPSLEEIRDRARVYDIQL